MLTIQGLPTQSNNETKENNETTSAFRKELTPTQIKTLKRMDEFQSYSED
jgi:hypothetical protein